MKLPEPLDRIDGEARRPVEVAGAWIACPNTGRRLEPQVATDDASLERALAAAHEAHRRGDWRELAAAERAAILEGVGARLEAQAATIAALDAALTGIVVRTTTVLASLLAPVFRGAAQQLRTGVLRQGFAGRHGAVEVYREPWGPAAVIAPWNAPAVIAAHKVASALAAGCPVVLKPSEWAPHSCRVLAEVLADSGLPRGVFQLVHGGAAVGARLVADRRVAAVSFTGGLAGGRAVAAACAEQLKPVQLELGGNNPLVVLEDADVSAAADGVVAGLATLNGQWCRAVGRVLVHESRRAALVAAVEARLAGLALGDSREPASVMGPLVHEGHRRQVGGAVERYVQAGARALAVSPLPALDGWFFPPTLVEGVPVDAARDEVFGPVATVHTFRDDAEALRLANDSPYGLAGYVFGAPERALPLARQLRVGSAKVNGVSLLALHPDAPRPAWGLSGMGDEGVRETLLFFTGARVVGEAAPWRPS